MLVESRHLMDVEWNEGVLRIQFNSGDVYNYYDVPSGIYEELMAAPSKSSYFRENIKGAFPYARQ
jgi:hypothetical protein